MKLIKVFSEEGHSGMSAQIQVELFSRLARFKTLSPITNDPAEWMEISEEVMGKKGVWQNKRDRSWFSEDGGKTGYSVDDKERKIKTFTSWRR